MRFAGQAAQESASDRNRKTVSADDVLSVVGQMGLPPESQRIMQQHLAGTSLSEPERFHPSFVRPPLSVVQRIFVVEKSNLVARPGFRLTGTLGDCGQPLY